MGEKLIDGDLDWGSFVGFFVFAQLCALYRNGGMDGIDSDDDIWDESSFRFNAAGMPSVSAKKRRVDSMQSADAAFESTATSTKLTDTPSDAQFSEIFTEDGASEKTCPVCQQSLAEASLAVHAFRTRTF